MEMRPPTNCVSQTPERDSQTFWRIKKSGVPLESQNVAERRKGAPSASGFSIINNGVPRTSTGMRHFRKLTPAKRITGCLLPMSSPPHENPSRLQNGFFRALAILSLLQNFRVTFP